MIPAHLVGSHWTLALGEIMPRMRAWECLMLVIRLYLNLKKEACCVWQGCRFICWLENCHALWPLWGVKPWTFTHHVQKWVILGRAVYAAQMVVPWPHMTWAGYSMGLEHKVWQPASPVSSIPSFLLWKYQLISSHPLERGWLTDVNLRFSWDHVALAWEDDGQDPWSEPVRVFFKEIPCPKLSTISCSIALETRYFSG